MSDWIEIDGKKYYEQGYLTMANNTARRRGLKIDEQSSDIQRLQSELEAAEGRLEFAKTRLGRGLAILRSELIESDPNVAIHKAHSALMGIDVSRQECDHSWSDPGKGNPDTVCVKCGDPKVRASREMRYREALATIEQRLECYECFKLAHQALSGEPPP